jgi:hypothetical protein
MTFPQDILTILSDRPHELLSTWHEEHLKAISLASDRTLVRELQPRHAGLLAPLSRALSHEDPDDWASFAHREVVQIVTLWATFLAGGGATAGAVACLIPSLGRAFERLHTGEVARLVVPLAALCQEAYMAACLRLLERQQQQQLVATTPILRVSNNTLLVPLCGQPDVEAANAIVERVLQEVLSLPTGSPVVVLDVSALEPTVNGVLEQFLSIASELRGIGGRCSVTGWQHLGLAEEQTSQTSGDVSWRDSLAVEIAQTSGRRWLSRLSRSAR